MLACLLVFTVCFSACNVLTDPAGGWKRRRRRRRKALLRERSGAAAGNEVLFCQPRWRLRMWLSSAESTPREEQGGREGRDAPAPHRSAGAAPCRARKHTSKNTPHAACQLGNYPAAAQVWRALCKPYHEVVAVKLLDLENMNCSLVGGVGGWVGGWAGGRAGPGALRGERNGGRGEEREREGVRCVRAVCVFGCKRV